MTEKQSTNWFDQGGRNYALFRPEYPPELARVLAGLTTRQRRAVDVGCGTGQLTAQLATYFDDVIGVDPSAEQIANAKAHPRVRYLIAAAEQIPLDDHSADLITAAQAAHWFDRPAFYAEARRLAAPNAVIALISYGVMQIDDGALNKRFASFYRDEIGPFWPRERKLVDSGYADIDFPFAEIPYPDLSIERNWRLQDFLGYLSTWSAVRRANEAGKSNILDTFFADFSRIWGDGVQRVSWPINMRLGRI